jgi:HTH-type transcriptional regulator / antitoxin HipB
MLIRTVRDLGHLIRDRRSRLGLTQAALADSVGVSRKWIVELEAGKRSADISLILRTVKALGLDVDVRDRMTRPRTDGPDLDQIIERSKKSR